MVLLLKVPYKPTRFYLLIFIQLKNPDESKMVESASHKVCKNEEQDLLVITFIVCFSPHNLDDAIKKVTT